MTTISSPGESNRPLAHAWEWTYQFDPGWRFVQAIPETATPILLAEHPHAIGMWIYGDQSGNALRLRVTDAEKQTFQPNGPKLDWTGWRWVEFDLADLKQAGHWGGADDGVARAMQLAFQLAIDADGAGTLDGAGNLDFAGNDGLRGCIVVH